MPEPTNPGVRYDSTQPEKLQHQTLASLARPWSGRLASLQATDPGTFVLAVHAFVEGNSTMVSRASPRRASRESGRCLPFANGGVGLSAPIPDAKSSSAGAFGVGRPACTGRREDHAA